MFVTCFRNPSPGAATSHSEHRPFRRRTGEFPAADSVVHLFFPHGCFRQKATIKVMNSPEGGKTVRGLALTEPNIASAKNLVKTILYYFGRFFMNFDVSR